MNSEALDTLFTTPKDEDTGWFTLDKFGEKKWNLDKVRRFWKEFEDHKIQKEDYNFEGFVFPIFRKNRRGYYFSSNSGFKKNVSFSNVTFEDTAYFNRTSEFSGDFIMNNVHLKDKLNFHGARFFGTVKIRNCTVDGDIDFVATYFKYASFYDVICKGNLDFRSAQITKAISFASTNISGVFLLDNITVEKEIYLKKSQFNDVVSLNETAIKSDFRIVDCNFNSAFNIVESGIDKFQLLNVIFDAQFKMLKCSLGYAIVEDTIFDSIFLSQINFQEPELYPAIIGFLNIDFPNKSKFERLNLKEVTFNFCELSTIKFRNCVWNVKNRIILEEEELNLLDSENHYRQLKSGFKSVNNWELSGNAYVSEMEMRKLRLYKEKRYVSWFIYWFYDKFGSYTQNFLRPFYLFLLFTFIVFPLIYFFFDTTFFLFSEVSKSYQKSVASALPFLKSDLLEDSNWWLKSFQTFFSGILLTFFILALRKRFKQ